MAEGSDARKRLEEIFDINRRFIDLITRQEGRAAAPAYGLDERLCGEIGALTHSQRDVIASVPVLLVTVTRSSIEKAGTVRDSESPGLLSPLTIEAAEQVFGASLMTWLTQDSQQRHTLASLWLGPGRAGGEPVRDLNFGEIQSIAPHAASILKARFADRPGCGAT